MSFGDPSIRERRSPDDRYAVSIAIPGAVKKFVVAIVVAVIGGYALMTGLQRQIVFPRHLITVPDEPRALPDAADQIWIETPEGRVEGWYMTGEGRSKQNPGPAVLFTHGNGEVIDHWPRLLEWYATRGVSALLVEYRGYGRSAGDPSSEKITDDMVEFREWVVDRPEVDPDELIYHGRSLGGGAACALARRHPPAAVILQSTFTSLADLAWEHYAAPEFLLRDEFDNLSFVESTDLPLLITHGSRDDIIPVDQARRLHEAAASSRFVEIEGCGHNDCPMKWGEIEQYLQDRQLL